MNPNERLTTILQKQRGMDPRRVIMHSSAHVIQHHGAIQQLLDDAEQNGAGYRMPLLSLPMQGKYTVAIVPPGNTVELRHVRLGALLVILLDGSKSKGPDAWDLQSLVQKVHRVVVAPAPHTEGQFNFLAKRVDTGGSIMVVETEQKNHDEWCRGLHAIAPTKLFQADSSSYPRLQNIALSDIAA